MLLNKVLYCILFLSISVAQPDDRLLGSWERQGDAWEGMRLEVIEQQGQYFAKITALPPQAKQWGFQIGDVKWQNIQPTQGKWFIFEDLYMNKGRRYSYYKTSRLVLENEGLLKSQVAVKANEWIGQSQTWVKIAPHHL